MEEEILEEEISTTENSELDESILNNIKKLLGLSETDTSFDTDVIIHINSAFMVLNQLGVGPIAGFRISNSDTKWSDYVSEDSNLEALKTYIHLKVKIVFDPPLSSTVMDAHKEVIKEMEWRLNVGAESKGG